MLNSLISRKLPILLAATLTSLLPLGSVNASTFQETEVDQNEFIAIAQPFGEKKYNLIVIEQIPEKQSCWNEIPESSNPVNVDLLLMNFDFTGHCRRSTDANGYSIRYNGEDYGLDYLLSLVEKDGQLLLMGTNRRDRSQPPIIVGSSEGLNGQPMKIKLNPGWRFSKRSYEGKVLGHVYFSYNPAAPTEETNEMNDPNLQQPLEQQSEEVLPNPTTNIREIVAPKTPNIQSQKQIKKSHKVLPSTNNIHSRFSKITSEFK